MERPSAGKADTMTHVDQRNLLHTALFCVVILVADLPRAHAEGQGALPQSSNGATTASCIFDATSATTYLSQAGTAIDMATRGCNPVSGIMEQTDQVTCAVNVAEVIKSFGFAASFLSNLVNECAIIAGHDVNSQAKCSADVTGIVGAVGAMSMGGAGIDKYCTTEEGKNNYVDQANPQLAVPPRVPNGALAYVPPNQQTRAQRGYAATQAMCVIYSMQSAWFLARAALNIDSAVSTCSSTGSKAGCAASVSGIVSAFAAVASYVSGAAATCAHGVHVHGAGCSAMIPMLVSGMAGVASSASAASCDCNPDCSKRDVNEDTGEASGRRLVGLNLTASLSLSSAEEEALRRLLSRSESRQDVTEDSPVVHI